MKFLAKEDSVDPSVYDSEWINETWGWDTPESFIQSKGMNIRPRIMASINLAALRPGMRILDIGCGRGEIVLHCGRLGIQAVGVDYSEKAIDLAEKSKAVHSLEEQRRMQFWCKNIHDIEIHEPFDRIFMLDVVEHLYDWELSELFQTCYHLLKDEGALIIHTLPNKWLYEITYRRILRFFMPWLPPNPRTEKEMAIHVNEMTILHLNQVLEKAEFASRVWLQDLVVEQAIWHQKQPLHDRRAAIYKRLSKPVISVFYKLLAKTPFRLLMVNEMFAVAWKKGQPQPIKTPFHLTESFFIKMSS